MKVTILGAGAYGTALGGVLTDNGYDIEYYDPRVKKEKLSATTARAKAILVCVPSSTIGHVLPYLPKELPLIVATKGILSGKMFEDFRDWMVMSGPGYAEDIKARRMTHLTATDKRIVKMFGTKYLDFDETDEREGVLMCGALKNVYAILAGLLGLQPKTREYRKFLEDALFEMGIILGFNDYDPGTVYLNCGKGDLRVTCDYPSRNYEFGREVAKRGYFEPEKTVEGLATLKRLRRREVCCPGWLKLMGQILRESEKWG